MASRTFKNDFKPNILLNFKITKEGELTNNLVNCDYANLKNIHNTLTTAMKLHRSGKFKTARNSSV